MHQCMLIFYTYWNNNRRKSLQVNTVICITLVEPNTCNISHQRNAAVNCTCAHVEHGIQNKGHVVSYSQSQMQAWLYSYRVYAHTRDSQLCCIDARKLNRNVIKCSYICSIYVCICLDLMLLFDIVKLCYRFVLWYLVVLLQLFTFQFIFILSMTCFCFNVKWWWQLLCMQINFSP